MNKNGFTLVELLAVLVIMGIIMTIAVPSVFKISFVLTSSIAISPSFFLTF